jgi:hypothetical protein
MRIKFRLETRKEKATRKINSTWDDNIKIDLWEIGFEDVDCIHMQRTGAGSGNKNRVL